MKKTSTCPKCDSREIAGPLENKSSAGIIMLLTAFVTATYEAYTCMDCGYSEFYPDKKGMENIRNHYSYQK